MGCSPNVLFFSLLFIFAAWKLAGFCKFPWMISRYSNNHFQAPQLLKTLLFTCRNQTCAIAVVVSQACEPNHLQNLTIPALPESDAKVGQHTGASHPDPICSPLAPEIPQSAEGWPSPEEIPLSSPNLTSISVFPHMYGCPVPASPPDTYTHAHVHSAWNHAPGEAVFTWKITPKSQCHKYLSVVPPHLLPALIRKPLWVEVEKR